MIKKLLYYEVNIDIKNRFPIVKKINRAIILIDLKILLSLIPLLWNF